jgi:hypothetical protein
VTPATRRLVRKLSQYAGPVNARALGVSLRVVRAAADAGLVELDALEAQARLTDEGRAALAEEDA